MMGKYLGIIFFLAVNIAYSQQGIVSGILTYEDGKPVSDATVAVSGTQLGSLSDEDGYYEITNVPYGEYTLIISSIEIEPAEIKIKISQKTNTYNAKLKQGNLRLEEVVVKNKSVKTEIEEKGYAVNVIDTRIAQLQSIQTFELLDRTAGVRIRQSGGLGSNIEFNINGLSGNSVRVLIDGIPVRNYGPSFSLNSIPPALIERIEIYKGVVPSHLADDALGGAINIVLKKSIQSSLMASYSTGSFGTHQFNASGSKRFEKSGFTVNGSGFYNFTNNSYEVWGDKVYTINPTNGTIKRGDRYRRFHDDYQSYGGKIEAGFTNVKWADQFYIGGLFSDMYSEIQHGATMEIVYGNRFATQSTQMANLVYNKKDLFIKGLEIRLLATYSYLERNVIDTVPDLYSWNGNIIGKWANGGEQGRATLQLSEEDNYSLRANTFYQINPKNTIGINYLFNDFTRDQDDPYLTGVEREFQDTRFLTKSFVGITYENNSFNNKLKTSLFYKFYNQSIKTTHITRSGPGGGNAYNVSFVDDSKSKSGYGFALSYQLNPQIMFIASGENAIRMPQSTEVFGNNAENILANPNLNPEQSLNGNMGIIAGPFTIVDKRHELKFNLNGFIRDTKDMIRQGVPSAVSETFAFENLNAVISRGFDVEVNYKFSNALYIVANASLFDSKFNTQFDSNGNPFFYYGSRLRNVPYFTSNTHMRYDINNIVMKGSLLSLNYNFAFVNEFLRDWEGIGGANLDFVPRQLVHDLGLTYTLPDRKISLSLDAKNILNHQLFDNWALQKPGRAFYAKINYKII